MDSDLNSCTAHDYLTDNETTNEATTTTKKRLRHKWGVKKQEHNYPVTKCSFKLRDIYRNNLRTLNCAGQAKDISEQRYQKRGNV